MNCNRVHQGGSGAAPPGAGAIYLACQGWEKWANGSSPGAYRVPTPRRPLTLTLVSSGPDEALPARSGGPSPAIPRADRPLPPTNSPPAPPEDNARHHEGARRPPLTPHGRAAVAGAPMIAPGPRRAIRVGCLGHGAARRPV